MRKEDYSPVSSNPEYNFISAGNSTLMRQAQMTADTYISAAITDIDEKLGEGYAKKHPELIAAYMQTAAIDLGTAIIARALEGVANAVENVSTSLDRQQGE